MEKNTPLLELRDVVKSYGGADSPETPVLRGVTLRVDEGDSVAIVGPSGCGKSTLLNIIGTLDSPTSGTVSLGGRDPAGLDEKRLADLRNREIGFVFQMHHLLPQCTVLENVLVPTLVQDGSGGAMGRAHALLERVGLRDRLEHRPGQLSGGERQRVAVVRALINRPRIILADEPTGALDRGNAAMLGDLLVRVNDEDKMALVVVTHALDLAGRMRRHFTLEDGHLRESALP
jgi:lipoprotein-releasing system ATP-binding protein